LGLDDPFAACIAAFDVAVDATLPGSNASFALPTQDPIN
jgi:hypothetical protein